eukprot:10808986-Alexandrium_andersonii.AAC.1
MAPNRQKSETPPAALPGAGGAALRAAPPAFGATECGLRHSTFSDSEPRRGPFGSLGALGPPPPRVGCWAPSSL